MLSRRVLFWLPAAAAIATAQAATLHLRIVDESGAPAAARVRLRDSQGKLHPVRPVPVTALPAHPAFADLGIVVEGDCSLEAPDAALSAEVDRGTEYIPEIFPVRSGPRRVVRLKRWVDMARRGWWSADLHVHRRPSEIPLLMKAAGLNLSPGITKWNLNTKLETWPGQSFFRVSPTCFYSVNNAEDERPWGAALFFNLKEPIALYDGKSMWPPPTDTFAAARKAGAFIDQEKVIWWAAPVMAALIPPDFIGVANNHFLEEGLLNSEAWGRPRDTAKYPGFRGFADYIFDLYYLYLSAGLRIPASAGSANGVLKNPLGYSRSYVYLDSGFSPETWFAAQRSGRNFVTNGPMLFFTVNGKMPGSVLNPGAVAFRLEALSRVELENAEVIVNGRVVRTFTPARNRSRVNGTGTIQVPEGGWIAARCFEKNERTVRFAHSSPVYISETPARDPGALARMREWIDAYMAQVRAAPASLLNSGQKERWLEACRTARARYQ